jgi:hypothetical protein
MPTSPTSRPPSRRRPGPGSPVVAARPPQPGAIGSPTESGSSTGTTGPLIPPNVACSPTPSGWRRLRSAPPDSPRSTSTCCMCRSANSPPTTSSRTTRLTHSSTPRPLLAACLSAHQTMIDGSVPCTARLSRSVPDWLSRWARNHSSLPITGAHPSRLVWATGSRRSSRYLRVPAKGCRSSRVLARAARARARPFAEFNLALLPGNEAAYLTLLFARSRKFIKFTICTLS